MSETHVEFFPSPATARTELPSANANQTRLDAVSKGLKIAAGAKTPPLDIAKSWESVPSLKDLAGPAPDPVDHSSQALSFPSRPSQGLLEPALDLSKVRSELSTVLVNDAARSQEPQPAENSLDGSYASVQEGQPTSAQGLPKGIDAPGRYENASLEASASGFGTRSFGPNIGIPGLEAAVLQNSLASQSSPLGFMIRSDQPGVGSGDGFFAGAGGSGVGPSGTEQAVGRSLSIGLPGADSIADQMTFAQASLDSTASPSAMSAFFSGLNQSSVAASAFSPLLSDPGIPDPGVLPNLTSAGRYENLSQPLPSGDTWSDQRGMLPTEQGNGPSIDLSKTNELLQQLLDEIRKGRRSFLPLKDSGLLNSL